jgi:hypothetical protein
MKRTVRPLPQAKINDSLRAFFCLAAAAGDPKQEYVVVTRKKRKETSVCGLFFFLSEDDFSLAISHLSLFAGGIIVAHSFQKRRNRERTKVSTYIFVDF